jgi:HAD superfamily hydrolase (TIGR01509 family)
VTAMSGMPGTGATAVQAVSFDFANTLVPVDRAAFRTVVELTLEGAADRCRITDRGLFLRAWDEERDRQFREDVPAGREVDLGQRVGRVLARCRGVPSPPDSERWDDDAALRMSAPDERSLIVDLYTRSFVHALPPPPHVTALLGRLAGSGLRLGLLTNWPLSITIERYVEAAGWARFLTAVVVSERVGTIKPNPAIFAVAERELGVPASAILHVGDDWMADVVGAKRSGWLACYLRDQPRDWPRQAVEGAADVEADLTIERLSQLETGLATFGWRPATGVPKLASRP